MKTGEIIKNMRKEQNVTQEDLAVALNISAQSISKWENGLSNPDITYIPLLANFFQVSIETLFLGENDEQDLHYKKSQDTYKKLLIEEDIDAIIKLWEDMHFRYPNDYRVLKELIQALCSKKDISLFQKIFQYTIILLKGNESKALENEVIDSLKIYMLQESDDKLPEKGNDKTNTDILSQEKTNEIFGNFVHQKKSGKRVILVDDSPFMRNIQNEILSEAGYQIVGEATNGHEAVEQYKMLSPDIIIMDIVMPELDGISAVKLIKTLDPDACIVMCSALTKEPIISEAKSIGANAFIAKPFRPEMLVGTIDYCIK
ncbi:MAG TPA: response regulator [Lachnospiraceae bacterium]|nr:response regulator [Lachnospiraceae bacterium]